MSRAFSTAAALLVLVATSQVGAQPRGTPGRAVTVPAPTAGGVATILANAASRTTIQGNALDSNNRQLAKRGVRLRDARFGHIVQTQYTDPSGMFAFDTLEPGTYVVEIIANDQSILAASELLTVHSGETVSTIVKLPFRIPPFAALMGTTSMRAAVGVALVASATGIAALVPTAPISPNQ